MAKRAFIVAALLLLSVLCWSPDLRRIAGHPLGETGITFDYNDVVTAVDPPAASSGIRIGDRLDLSKADISARSTYGAAGSADAGTLLRLPMLRGTRPYIAQVVTAPETSDRIDVIWLRDAAQILVMLVATLVLLRRPGIATWGLFLAVVVGCGTVNDVYLLGPAWWRVVGINLFWVVANNGTGAYGLLLFAVYLLHDGALPVWRRNVRNATLLLAATCLLISLWQANSIVLSTRPNGTLWIAYSVLLLLPFFAAPVVLIATYFESARNVRERLRWIIGGFLISAICNALDQAGSQGNLGLIQMSYVTHSFLVCGIYLFVTAPVAYAILKHHIIDINVAISRATVYTLLSVFIVGLFALVDLFFTRALAQNNAGLIADIGLALVLGFSFNTMHGRVDAFVDRFLFRARHVAEEHVRAVADGMAFAHSEAHVHSMLTKEPLQAFDLTGARIITELSGAPDDLQTLASCVEAHRGAVRVSDGQWNLQPAVFNEFMPAIAVPVLSHGSVDAFVLYGLHANGTDLDAEEVALLERLCSGAGSAMDRLEAERLRLEIAQLRGIARV